MTTCYQQLGEILNDPRMIRVFNDIPRVVFNLGIKRDDRNLYKEIMEIEKLAK